MPFDITTAKQVEQPKISGFDISSAKPLEMAQENAENTPERKTFSGEIGRQIGLTARGAIQGVGDTLGIATNPIAYAQGKITGQRTPYAGELATRFADYLGLPEARTKTERIAGKGVSMMSGVGGIASAAKFAPKVVSVLAARPASQLAGAAGGGVAGQTAKEKGAGPLGQAGAALAGATAGYGATAGLTKAINYVNGAIKNIKGTNSEIQAVLLEALKPSGAKLGDIPKSVRESLIKEIQTAKRLNRDLDTNAIRRIMDYRAIGATPTRGTVTGDAVTLTRERNLAKQGANLGGQAGELARVQQRNNEIFTQRLGAMGADDAIAAPAAGERLMSSLRHIDAPKKAVVDKAYQAVRDADGRYANIDTRAFSQRANDMLDEGQWGSVLPEKAKSLLNDVSSGKIPLNVNTAVQLDKRLSGIGRAAYAAGDKDASSAVSVVRDALKTAPLESSAGQEAMQKYEMARSLAAKRFQAIEANPAMKAALNDDSPDKFMQQFVTGQGRASDTRSVNALAKDLVDDPESFDLARRQIVLHLQKQALSGRSPETGNFSAAAFEKAMDKIGDGKLSAFFSKDEMNLLKTMVRVSSAESYQPTGSAINNSNTASALTGLLDTALNSKILSRSPTAAFHEEPLRNWLSQRVANEALRPQNILAIQASRGGVPPTAFIPSLTQPNSQ